jgi:hypothetical protein
LTAKKVSGKHRGSTRANTPLGAIGMVTFGAVTVDQCIAASAATFAHLATSNKTKRSGGIAGLSTK